VSDGGHTRKREKATQRFDSEKLAALTKRAEKEGKTPPPAPEPAPTEATPPLAVTRAMTVEDPITTQLLAEIARGNEEEVELDDEGIDDAVDKLGDGERPHPHTRRRR